MTHFEVLHHDEILPEWFHCLYIIDLKLSIGDKIEITPFFNIVNYKNTGFIFGIFSEIPYMLYVVINIFLLIIVLYILIKLFFENDRLLIPLSLIAGGGIGNVFERFLYHGVTDFILFLTKVQLSGA